MDQTGSGDFEAHAVGAARRVSMTAALTALTAVVGAGQLLGDEVVFALQRNRHLLMAGQLWRAVTPMFVQPSGLSQYAFNLVGCGLVGVAVERHLGPGRWLAVYFGAGVAGILMTYVWFPAQTGGGSSDAIAGLIGALVVQLWITRSTPWLPGLLYATFFVVYLTGRIESGFIVCAAAGGVAVAVVAVICDRAPAALSRTTTSLLILGCAVALIAMRDDHGVGLSSGIVLTLLLHRRSSNQGRRIDCANPH